MIQFVLDALRGAAALLLVLGAAVLVIWLIVPGMGFQSEATAAARFAARSRSFNAMFGGLAILAMLAFGLMAWANNH